MEEAYRDLASQLSYQPNENIIVILYTQRSLLTSRKRRPGGAINDGKLRIPIGGVTVMNPQLERILKHELTHSFLRLWRAAAARPGSTRAWRNSWSRAAQTHMRSLWQLFSSNEEKFPFPCWNIPSSAFPTCRHRLHTQSLCPEWSTCATDTAWLKS